MCIQLHMTEGGVLIANFVGEVLIFYFSIPGFAGRNKTANHQG